MFPNHESIKHPDRVSLRVDYLIALWLRQSALGVHVWVFILLSIPAAGGCYRGGVHEMKN